MTKEYDDIIYHPRHVSRKRPQMPINNRAAQFAPFAALKGHDEVVEETARLTDQRLELDEYIKDEINDKLQIIGKFIDLHPEIKIRYFKPDDKKDGGQYISITGIVKKIDEYEKLIYMTDDKIIPIEEIINIEGQIFSRF